jgi:hypothetical protein
MKKVRVIYEAIVPEEQLKDEYDILCEYDSLNEAADLEELDAFIDGSYEYEVKFEIFDVEKEQT